MEKNTVVRSGDRVKTVLRDYVMLSLGTLLTTVGLYVFAMPHQFVMGGVIGISIVLEPLLPSFITAGVLVTILNMILLLVGFAFLGKDFGFKTVYTSIFLSCVGMLIEWLGRRYDLFPLTDNLLLELVLAVILPAVGTAIVFYYNGSGGGTDIVALIMKKYMRIEGGKALLCVDFLIMLVSFTYSVEIGLLSMLGLFMKSLIVDKVTKSMLRSKYCIIVTTRPDEIGEYINKKPYELSGGQQQRVAIARTLVLNPDIILFDEPMSALDVATRLSLRKELKKIQREFGTTMIYITHDQE